MARNTTWVFKAEVLNMDPGGITRFGSPDFFAAVDPPLMIIFCYLC